MRCLFTNLLLLLGLNLFAGGYEIKVKVNGLGNKNVYLGYYFADKTYVKDTIHLDENGAGVFKGNKKLDGGLYFMVLPTKTIAFEFLVTEKQEFSITTDSTDYTGKLKFKGSDENIYFNDYQRYIGKQNKKMAKLQERLKANESNADSSKIIKDEMQKMQNQVETEWKRILKEYPGTFFADIIKIQMTPEFPDFKVDEKITNKDSVLSILKYYYTKNHYFDLVNFSDDKLLRTQLYYNRLNTFFTQIVFQPDTLIAEGEKVIEKAKVNHDVFKYTLEYLLNLPFQTKRMNMDKLLVYFGEKYFLSGQADWVDTARMAKIRDRVVKTKPNLIGNIAPEVKIITLDNNIRTLSSIKAKYTILAFWEPSCGHCKKLIPKLHEIYETLWQRPGGVEVMAVMTQPNLKTDWEKFIDDNAMTDWINGYDPYYWTDFRNKYDVYSTPTIYILNEKKQIIAKRIDVDQIPEFIDSFEKSGGKL
ncbi:MAG: thioredoxin-like domain-containing protein [Bacteroidia bacterium]|nr:thioredoxin-like domain-containing protein [Bacteroidia bacterium]